MAALAFALIASAFALALSSSNGPAPKGRKAGVIHPLDVSHHECDHFGALACPSSSASGQLSSADCRLNDESFIDLLQFGGTAGQTVTIDMSSGSFDAYLFLLDPGPSVVAQNDDFGESTNSRITYTLTASGTWTIGATSLGPNEQGGYSITLQCSSAPPPTPTPIPGPCVPGPTTLCVNGGRFRAQMDWTTPDGQSGAANAVAETSDTGMFWFFTPNNIEAIVKVVDGCSFNQRYWVFAGGLTDVATTLRVTDTQSGVIRTYVNPQGTPFQPIQDTAAFATCP